MSPSLRNLYIAVFLLLMWTIGLRLVFIDRVPYNLNPDEADTIRAYLHATHGEKINFFGFNWNGAPVINTYIIGAALKFGEYSYAAIKIPSIIFSTITTILLFLLIYKTLKNTTIAFAASFALAGNIWFLNFSRSAWENIFNCAILLIVIHALYGYYKGESKFRNTNLKLLIVGGSLAFYFYHPGKLYIPAILLTLLFIPAKRYKFRARLVDMFLVFNLSILLVTPQLYQIYKNRGTALNRVQAVSILNQAKPISVFISNTAANLDGFLFFSRNSFPPGNNDRYLGWHRPVNIAITYLYLIGIIFALLKFPYMVIFSFLVLFPAEVLSIDTPDAARSIHYVPMVYFFAALGGDRIYGYFKSAASRKLHFIIYASVIGLFIISGFIESKWYFDWITSEKALNSREPAVWRYEYDTWLNTLQRNINEGKGGFMVSEWKQIRHNPPQ